MSAIPPDRIVRTSQPPSPLEMDRYTRITNYIDGLFPKEGPGGCSVILMRDGETLFSHSSGMDASIDHPQHYGSVSKQFTAAAILHLVQMGKVKLDTDIRTLLPHLPTFKFQGEPVTITIDHLLQMQSGLPDVVDLAFLRGIPDETLSQEGKMAPFYNRGEMELSFKPGEESRYCNSNYYLLSDIVEIVSGNDLRTYAHDHLFQPFHMNDTDFIDRDRAIEDQTIPGFSEEGEPITTQNKTWGACGVIGAPRDMVKWDYYCPRSSLWPLLTEDPKGENIYARGLHVEKRGDYRLIYHPGGIEGFQTMYLKVENTKDHSSEFSLFIASNRESKPGRELVHNWAYHIANEFMGKPLFSHPEGPPPEEGPGFQGPRLNHDRQVMLPHKGHYSCSLLGIGHTLEVAEDHGVWGLKMQPDGVDEERFTLLFAQDPQNPLRYLCFRGPPSIQLEFTSEGFILSDPARPIPPLSFYRS